jgi:hypothetical protein
VVNADESAGAITKLQTSRPNASHASRRGDERGARCRRGRLKMAARSAPKRTFAVMHEGAFVARIKAARPNRLGLGRPGSAARRKIAFATSRSGRIILANDRDHRPI